MHMRELLQELPIDAALAGGKRSLRTMPKACLLGSTGARLWADFLWPAPGFSGAIDFIHKINLPSLFTVRCDAVQSYEPLEVNWYPSRMTMRFASGKVKFEETKFITWEDCAVSCQTWTNTGSTDIKLSLVPEELMFTQPAGGAERDGLARPPDGVLTGISGASDNNGMPDAADKQDALDTLAAPGLPGESGAYRLGYLEVPQYEFAVAAMLKTSHPALYGGLTLRPGETVRLIVAASLGLRGADEPAELQKRLDVLVAQPQDPAAVIAKQQQAYQAWFDRAPSFVCNEPLLNTTWSYRWYVLRHNLADPRCGRLQHPLFYEGRSHKMSKTPLAPKGWEFSKMIPLTVPLHLLESRWHADGSASEGAMLNMKASQDAEGFYNCLFVNQTLHSYANFMGWAVYQHYLVCKDIGLVKTMLESLKRQVDGEAAKLGNPADGLLTEYTHNRTGKEYQPSYWYFHGYPEDCKNPETFTPLKRVDRSVYHYLNSLGVSRLCRAAGDPDAEHFERLAERIQHDVLDKMWDEETRFFYDLHYETDEKAWVKNIVGFYPYWAQMTGDRHADGLYHALAEGEFATPCPFPSVAADCPVYAPEGGWQGRFFKGRNGCVWDGPTWPYTNSIVLDALASAGKREGGPWEEAFGRLFREYSLLHYRGRELGEPYLVEHYSSQTGEPLSDEVDYNHSYYIDLVIRHIAGLRVEEDRLVLEPADIGLSYFRLDRIRAAGRSISITYNRGDDPAAAGLPVGYRLYVDGELALENAGLAAMTYSLS